MSLQSFRRREFWFDIAHAGVFSISPGPYSPPLKWLRPFKPHNFESSYIHPAFEHFQFRFYSRSLKIMSGEGWGTCFLVATAFKVFVVYSSDKIHSKEFDKRQWISI